MWRRDQGRGRTSRRFSGHGSPSHHIADFSPPDISNNVLWLRADQGVVGVGSSVSSWQSQSPWLAITLSEGDGLTAGTLLPNALNGQPAVQFPSGAGLSTSIIPTQNQDYTYAVVYRPDGDGLNDSVLFCGTTDTLSGFEYEMDFGYSRNAQHMTPSGGHSDGNATIGQFEIVVVTRAAGQAPRMWVNGIEQSIGGSADYTPPIGTSRLVLNAFWNETFGNIPNGECTIAELAMYDVAISVADVMRLSNAWAQYWAL